MGPVDIDGSKWTVIETAGTDGGHNTMVLVRCACGFEAVRIWHDVRTGKSKQCCQCRGDAKITHGAYIGQRDLESYSDAPDLRLRVEAFKSARYRTQNDPYYAGVKIWWTDVDHFLANPPYGEFRRGKVLARFDDTGDYHFLNCEWQTKTQSAETVFTLDRHSDGRPCTRAAKEEGVSPVAVWALVRYADMTVDDAIARVKDRGGGRRDRPGQKRGEAATTRKHGIATASEHPQPDD